ncbi:type VI secretion system baseplate subunit TssE [Pseudomonas gingeri]|uniref:type VI secretion system baseplate subunit TssE n=1 Tax=Pseudomonas gingeri TaxID=117681 RepID=UPI0015A0C86D|nr:type VI secretion system baseplate subunit TssE [Pseudomonas gingeri]NWA02530.1 type VI secretion system baseplate subunit TssE [Pseudomonas gingeri]NWA12297.1 type VI secretion system baseplate subunit TssE [Pseudomonas gingeri]NWA57297.1 type VI secretion system baseplate subunit TssE [Pseudomonas gingeri]NWA93640.1 type VI secretion system baseplate subunit TssE [Pseudomonas gingeri]NWB03112.1 type VI secretion system baseplate subunit TssE [Pseudomonas gingeri]
MAELTSKERLQPSLLDRLTDEDTQATQESRDKRVLSMRGLRKAVLRDLGWLLNSTSLGSFRDLAGHPLTAQSALNFGLPDLSGKTAAGLDREELGRRIRQAIWDFEPRILRDSVRVEAIASAGAAASPNQVTFEIHGELWGQPLPERLYLKTELDLEAGEVKVFDIESRDLR